MYLFLFQISLYFEKADVKDRSSSMDCIASLRGRSNGQVSSASGYHLPVGQANTYNQIAMPSERVLAHRNRSDKMSTSESFVDEPTRNKDSADHHNMVGPSHPDKTCDLQQTDKLSYQLPTNDGGIRHGYLPSTGDRGALNYQGEVSSSSERSYSSRHGYVSPDVTRQADKLHIRDDFVQMNREQHARNFSGSHSGSDDFLSHLDGDRLLQRTKDENQGVRREGCVFTNTPDQFRHEVATVDSRENGPLLINKKSHAYEQISGNVEPNCQLAPHHCELYGEEMSTDGGSDKDDLSDTDTSDEWEGCETTQV